MAQKHPETTTGASRITTRQHLLDAGDIGAGAKHSTSERIPLEDCEERIGATSTLNKSGDRAAVACKD